MSVLLTMLDSLKSTLNRNDLAVCDRFDPTPTEGRIPSRYLVVGFGEIRCDSPAHTADGTVYPLQTELTLSLYDLPDADARDMLACMEEEILGAVPDAGFAPVRVVIEPALYDRTTDKLLLRASLTVACSYQRKAEEA